MQKAKAAAKKALMSEEEKAARGRVLGMRKLNGEWSLRLQRHEDSCRRPRLKENSGPWLQGLREQVTESLEALEAEGADMLAMQGKPVTAEVLEGIEREDQRDIVHRDGHMKALQRVI